MEVNGPSSFSTIGDYNFDNQNVVCTVADENTTPMIMYTLTAPGTHTVFMSSYAAVAQYYTDIADEFIEDSLTFEVVEPVINVSIDIKPGSDPNCFNSNGNGLIPVAILESADFDASSVYPFTVALDGSGVRVKGKSGNAGSLEDANGDGYLDLVVQIEDDSSYTSGDTTAVLTGKTLDGTPIEGSDSICIRPPE